MKKIKKVGIVTRYDDNYGACLQAAALQNILHKHEIYGEIIRYNPPSEQIEQNTILNIMKKIKKVGLLNAIQIACIRKYIQKRKNAFQNFRNKKISITDNVFHNSKEMEKIKDKYNAFICGSDMIWCEEFLELLDVYFLQFAPKGKRIAYSPSFGRTTLKEENKLKYSKLINDMDYISCRERSGLRIVKELSGKEATHTVDPTLLLTKEEWLTLIPKNSQIKKSKNYILKYMFTELTKNGKTLVSNICNEANIIMRSVPSTRSEYKAEEKEGIIGHGPFEFLSMYAHSNFIITNTFHGLIFALIFEKPFLVFKREDSGNWAKYDERLISILEELNLQDRYVSQNSIFKKEWLELNYTEINEKIEKWRLSSEIYLFNSLEEVCV